MASTSRQPGENAPSAGEREGLGCALGSLPLTLAWPWAEGHLSSALREAVREGAWRGGAGLEQSRMKGSSLVLQGSTKLERGDEALWTRRMLLERVLAVLI